VQMARKYYSSWMDLLGSSLFCDGCPATRQGGFRSDVITGLTLWGIGIEETIDRAGGLVGLLG